MKKYRDIGASALELTFIIVIFLMIVLGAVYLGFFITTKAMVDAGIGRGLDYASVTRHLNEDRPRCSSAETQGGAGTDGLQTLSTIGSGTGSYRECCQNSAFTDHPWCIALRETIAHSLRIPENTMIAETNSGFAYINEEQNPVTVTFPVPELSSGVSQETIFRERPISIELCYNVRSIFGNFVQTCSTGYIMREIPILSAGSIATDCNGTPEGSPDYNNLACECNAANGDVPAQTESGVNTCIECTFPNTSAVQETFDHDGDPATAEIYRYIEDKFFIGAGYLSTECMCLDCEAVYGPLSESQDDCRCICSGGSVGSDGGSNTNNFCECGSAPASATSSDGTSIPFLPNKIPDPSDDTLCICQKDPSGPFGGGDLTDADCGIMEATSDLCACRCPIVSGCRSYNNLCQCEDCGPLGTPDGSGGCECNLDACPDPPVGGVFEQNSSCGCVLVCDEIRVPGHTECACFCDPDISDGCEPCNNDGGTHG